MNNEQPLFTFRNFLIAGFFILVVIALMAVQGNLPAERPTFETIAVKDTAHLDEFHTMNVKLYLVMSKWKVTNFGIYKKAVGVMPENGYVLTFIGLPDGYWYLQ